MDFSSCFERDSLVVVSKILEKVFIRVVKATKLTSL